MFISGRRGSSKMHEVRTAASFSILQCASSVTTVTDCSCPIGQGNRCRAQGHGCRWSPSAAWNLESLRALRPSPCSVRSHSWSSKCVLIGPIQPLSPDLKPLQSWDLQERAPPALCLKRLLCVKIPGDQPFLSYLNHPVWQSFLDHWLPVRKAVSGWGRRNLKRQCGWAGIRIFGPVKAFWRDLQQLRSRPSVCPSEPLLFRNDPPGRWDVATPPRRLHDCD
ncbi:hypothetical protein COCON_G00146240 [Conger conger]|uniref:Uncharacterized protein n=1 Tax=Conger conger TaxID=82655 RepID=A0A9Q1DBT7_CONCO|nr:hypothetical protein COCON_G00146240 [Conger conger]